MNKIIVTGSGQSGTNWIANLFDEADNVDAYHEADGGEHEPCRTAKDHPQEAKTYMNEVKVPAIEHRVKQSDKDIYIEVNSFMRYHAPYFPDDYTVIHNVRDGRNVVRSMMERKSLVNDNGEWNNPLRPDKEHYSNRWNGWNNFQRACWFWYHPNERLYDNCDDFITLEDLNNHKEYVNDFTKRYNIKLKKQYWEKHRHDPDNENKKDFPSYEDWSRTQVHKFNEICGELNYKMGYEYA